VESGIQQAVIPIFCYFSFLISKGEMHKQGSCTQSIVSLSTTILQIFGVLPFVTHLDVFNRYRLIKKEADTMSKLQLNKITTKLVIEIILLGISSIHPIVSIVVVLVNVAWFAHWQFSNYGTDN
jgi:hypothetical protein|tara:strand:- start:4408 stop:4779 length:372 start_codon:yes stop_codon:yes gene_type:complete